VTTAGAPGFCRSGVADKQQLRIEIQIPQSNRRLQAVPACRSKTKFGAAGTNEGRDRIDRAAADGVDTRHRTARVVAMESHSGIRVQLGSGPWPKRRAELRADQALRSRARVVASVRSHRELIQVGAHPHRRAHDARPFRFRLRVHAGHPLPDAIFPCRRQASSCGGPIQTNGRQPVITDLNTDGALRVAIEQAPELSIRQASTTR
jgi:hypothetical protein